MLLPASHFAPDGCVTRAWGDGAYSDDLILAALAGELRRRILCPGCAVFPIHLPARCTLPQAWNYLRRQTYVLDTYTSEHNRCAMEHRRSGAAVCAALTAARVRSAESTTRS